MADKSNQKAVKNYYAILNIQPNASSFQIENAYQKLASQWHPDKHSKNRLEAEKKFQDINEAYELLSNIGARTHYDEILQKSFSVQDAHETFEKFYAEHGLQNEDESRFFEKNFPEKCKDYYKILGVPKNATQDEIRQAYRKLALKYHPKNATGDEVKFVELNEAFNALSNSEKRNTYDSLFRSTMPSHRAHDIFESFFENRLAEFPLQDEEFFKPLINRKIKRLNSRNNDTQEHLRSSGSIFDRETFPSRDPLLRDPLAYSSAFREPAYREVGYRSPREPAYRVEPSSYRVEPSSYRVEPTITSRIPPRGAFNDPFYDRGFDQDFKSSSSRMRSDLQGSRTREPANFRSGEQFSTSTIYTNKNGKECQKKVTTRKFVENGDSKQEVLEEYLYPDGTQDITKTIKNGEFVDTKNYHLDRNQTKREIGL